MIKLPPIEKIPEAYTAIEDDRIVMNDESATVKSSNFEKEYLIKWKDNDYYSNDNSTYWQNYPGYPVIAILMLQGKLTLNRKVSAYFKNVNWNKLNKDNKRDYKKSVEDILVDVPNEEKELIFKTIEDVMDEIKNLDIELTKKKNFE